MRLIFYNECYLLDGRLEISNNRAERSVKPFVIDRKNFLFANTSRGAKASAIIFSLLETAKENGLSPYAYLTYIFQNAPNWNIYQDSEGIAESIAVTCAGLLQGKKRHRLTFVKVTFFFDAYSKVTAFLCLQ